MTEEMKIENKQLLETDIGSKVTYIPLHANGNASHPDCDGGTIASWNDKFVFVNYGTGTNEATRPEDLVFGKP